MDSVKDDTNRKKDRAAFGLAAGWVIIRHRPYRRNLLFLSTLVSLLGVFAGSVFLTAFLSTRPVFFGLYWLGCFLMVGFVLLLAFYDLIVIRKEHHERLVSLGKELAEAAMEARRLAEADEAEQCSAKTVESESES
tara:strand:- start:3965 stop:4372 length:408 start_codon:yes stop_codon:yes gene_type:complete